MSNALRHFLESKRDELKRIRLALDENRAERDVLIMRRDSLIVEIEEVEAFMKSRGDRVPE